MRVLFTGATSFTGMWFVDALARQGHSVIATAQNAKETYKGIKAQRIERLMDRCEFAWEHSFGTPAFIDLLASRGPFDVLCHHAADVADYKNPEFDVMRAFQANTLSLRKVLKQLRAGECRRVVLTGSVFEANEGSGTRPLRAASAYGLSKTLTAMTFSFHARDIGLAFGKFVIPNPFGPYEEPRFTEYLLNSWKKNSVPRVNTPRYVRDNIPVSLLAAAYARFTNALPQSGCQKFNPSFYAETQEAFTKRFASEIETRLKLNTPLEFAEQTDFSEPLVRINTDTLNETDFNWKESISWDEAAQYYARRFDIPLR